MNNRLSRLALIMLTGCLLINPLQAKSKKDKSSGNLLTSQWGIGLNASTFGFGGEIIKGLGPKFDIRAGYSTMNLNLKYNLDLQGAAVLVSGNINPGGPHLLFNFNPAPAFHLTLGAALNQTIVLVSAESLSNVPVEDIMVLPADFGFIEMILLPRIKVSPYVGIGFGRTLNRDKRLSFSFDLGTYYQASPSASLLAAGMLSPTAGEHNVYVINSLIKPYRWWPVLSAQLSYRIL